MNNITSWILSIFFCGVWISVTYMEFKFFKNSDKKFEEGLKERKKRMLQELNSKYKN